MSQMITIEAFKLEGFRAYLQPQIVSLLRGNKPLSLAVFAPNAKGKSSLVDAFEYYFSEEATLTRLGKRSHQSYAGPKALIHVHAEKNDVTPSVHFWFRQNGDKFNDKRFVSTTTPSLPEAAKRVLSYTKLPFIIRGYKLRSFVEETTPESRYKEISSWLALDPLLTIQQNLRSLLRQVKSKAESKTETNERLLDLKRLTKNMIHTWNETNVCTWLNENVLAHLDKDVTLIKVSKQDAGYQELTKRKASEDEHIGVGSLKQILKNVNDIHRPSIKEGEKANGSVIKFENAIEYYNIAFKHESDERSKASQAVFNKVWNSAKNLFERDDNSFETCPICDTAFEASPHGSRYNVYVSLIDKLKELADYQKAEKELKQAEKALMEAARDLKTNLDTAISNLNDVGYGDKVKKVVAYRDKIQSWKVGNSAPDSTEAVKELHDIHSLITTEKDRIESQQGERTYANALRVANQLLQIKSDLVRIKINKSELQNLHNELDKQTFAINKAIVEHTQNLIGRLQEAVDYLYKEIQGNEEDAPPVRLELPEESEKNQQRINLLIDFAENRQGVVPSGYLSDSQIHAMALAFRLSAIRLFNSCVPFIVLDDIVTSYDADHRKNIAAVLTKHFRDYQIILVTHDEQFFNILQDHFHSVNCIFRRITKIEQNFGPCFHDHRTPDEVIQSKLDAGESAAVEMRQAEEEWLLDICRSFGVKVVIRPVNRPYQYERSELAAALASFLKKSAILPPSVPGISNTFLSSLQKGAIENFSTHFSDNPYQNASFGDAKARWKEFQYFRDQFVCSKCGKARFKRPLTFKRPVCFYCETPFDFQSH